MNSWGFEEKEGAIAPKNPENILPPAIHWSYLPCKIAKVEIAVQMG